MITPTCWVSRTEKDVMSENPDIVLIEVGGNDCNFHWDEVAKNPEGDHEPIVPIERYLENVTQLVKQVQDKHITPFLLTLPPLDLPDITDPSPISSVIQSGISFPMSAVLNIGMGCIIAN